MSLSASGRLWKKRTDRVSVLESELAQEAGLHPALVPVITHRQLDSIEAIQAFFSPELGQLKGADPYDMRDMKEAVERLLLALERQEPIAVFGDYDVDGATSSALLVRYFRFLGVTIRVYIPDRLDEGYGPSVPAMEKLAAEGIRVIVTVDCGISSFEALAHAASRGMDVIVTDHHQLNQGQIPPAVAVVNPNRPDDAFPYKDLAGVGVAFYLVMALNRELRQRGWFTAHHMTEPTIRNLLDLVAVGTISDVAKLTGLNRVLVTAGLKVARYSENLGLNTLLRMAAIDLTAHVAMDAVQVGFQLGPRINAGGRLGKGLLGSELLFTEDPARAEEIAQLLEQSNRERQEIERRILQQALEMIDTQQLLTRRLGLVLASETWHPGVVGVVASRLVERFHRPTVVIAISEEKNEGKGSGRSIPGVDLLSAIQASSGHLMHFGGHKAAAGLSVVPARLPAFIDAFDMAVREQNDPALFHPTLVVDSFLPMSYVSHALATQLKQMQPFGSGNPEPVFIIEDVMAVNPQVMKGRHIRCELTNEQGSRLHAISFSALPGPIGELLLASPAEKLDVAGSLVLNRHRQREHLQFTIRDIRLAGETAVAP